MKRLDRTVVERALHLIETVVAQDPLSGKRLRGKYEGLWSYRFSDYRIVYRIEGQELVIVVLRVRHRRNVYDGL